MSSEQSQKTTSSKKFLVDMMLIKLGRWLRILGYDCRIPKSNEIEDEELLKIAEREKRVLITMDKKLSERKTSVNLIYIPSKMNSTKMQLEFLIKNNHISALFLGGDIESKVEGSIRCSECGAELLEVNKDELKTLNIYTTGDKKQRKSISMDNLVTSHDKFWVCKRCHHIYWKGSHWKKMIEFLSSLEANNQ